MDPNACKQRLDPWAALYLNRFEIARPEDRWRLRHSDRARRLDVLNQVLHSRAKDLAGMLDLSSSACPNAADLRCEAHRLETFCESISIHQGLSMGGCLGAVLSAGPVL
jgi:hypothetical protein